jgi:flagellar motility protein MotE (MotC chaperone)
MSEETQIPEFPEYTGFELLDIISNQLEVIATLAELSEAQYRTYEDELEDVNTVKRNTFRIIFAAQKKLSKYVKEYEQRNSDNQKV